MAKAKGSKEEVSSADMPKEENFPPEMAITGRSSAPTSSGGKLFAKSVHLGLGVDLLGSATSLNNTKGSTLEVIDIGILATGKSGRQVVIPWANIKGFELAGSEAKFKNGVPIAPKTLPPKPKPVAQD